MEDQALEALADLLGALGHPDRLRILLVLHREEQDVAHLAEEVGLSQPRTSQHLALLKAHQLVASRREGRRAVYALTEPELVPWLARGAGFLAQGAERSGELAGLLARLAARLGSS